MENVFTDAMTSENTFTVEELEQEATECETKSTKFTEIVANMRHEHGPKKSDRNDDDDDFDFNGHDLRDRFNVRDDFVMNYMITQSNGHSAVQELAKREEEFRGREAQIFRDIDSQTSESKINARWNEIQTFARNSAPIPEKSEKYLDILLEIKDQVVESQVEDNGLLTVSEISSRAPEVEVVTA